MEKNIHDKNIIIIFLIIYASQCNFREGELPVMN